MILSRDKKNLAKTELLIAYVLRYGALICAAVIGTGLWLRLLDFGKSDPSSNVINILLAQRNLGSYLPPKSLESFFAGMRVFDGDTFIAFGLLLLIALPITRVGLSVVLFLIERDIIYFCVTLFVLAILLLSVFFGAAI